MKDKRFLSLGEVQRKLNVSSRGQMESLIDLLPYVGFKQRHTTRFFPASYINALARHLGGQSATAQLVREFNATAEARRLYGEAQTNFEAAISERTEYTPVQVADILDVARSAVGGWMRAKALPFTLMRMKGGKPVPLGPRQSNLLARQFIQTQTLHDLFKWEAPF